MFSSLTDVAVTSVGVLIDKMFLTSASTNAEIATTAALSVTNYITGLPAPSERSMYVPAEDRLMMVA